MESESKLRDFLKDFKRQSPPADQLVQLLKLCRANNIDFSVYELEKEAHNFNILLTDDLRQLMEEERKKGAI